MKNIIILTFILIFSETASAQSKAFKPEFYLGLQGGGARLANNAQISADRLVSLNGGSAVVTQNRNLAIGRVFAGFKLTENFDAEIGYFQSGNLNINFSGLTGAGAAYSGRTTAITKGFDYSLLLRPSYSSGFNSAFLRIGGHRSKLDTTTSGVNIIGGSTSTSGNGYLYGLGYDINVNDNFDARLEVTRLQRIAGLRDNNSDFTQFSIGIIGKF